MSQLKKLILLIGDIGILYASLLVTLFIRYGRGGLGERLSTHLGPFSVIFAVWILVFYLADLYRHKTLRTRATFFRAFIPALLIANLVSIVIFYLFGPFFELTPKTNLFILAVIFLLGEYFWRTFMFAIFRSGSAGLIVLGTSDRMEETVAHLTQSPELGYTPLLWVKNKEELDYGALQEIVQKTDTPFIVLNPEFSKDTNVMSILYRLLPFRVTIMNFSDFYESLFERIPLNEIEEGWFIEYVTTRRPIYDLAKRIADLLIAFISCVVCIPLGIVIATCIKLTSRGPIIYKQERMGKNGKVFMLYKFRTMLNYSGQEGGTAWSLATTRGDTRITSLGKILRYTHLDEIPQLVNIAKGDISITGPRPERIELAREYATLSYYEIRHIIKPGLTGWAQINYRPSTSLKEAYEKLEYDIYYVKNRSIWLDLLILVRTIRYFFTNHG